MGLADRSRLAVHELGLQIAHALALGEAVHLVYERIGENLAQPAGRKSSGSSAAAVLVTRCHLWES